jgi:hypothetical protein
MCLPPAAASFEKGRRETFFPTQSPAHKKKNRKNKIQNEKNAELKISNYKYSNLEIQITVSNCKKLQTNPKIFAAKNNFAATANPKALAKPTSPGKKLKKPYNRWIILSPTIYPLEIPKRHVHKEIHNGQ